MPTQQMSETDVKGFADKLDTFASELTAKEQLVLGEILSRAIAFGEDVEGHHGIADPSHIVHQVPYLMTMGTHAWYTLHHHIQDLVAELNSAAAPALNHPHVPRPPHPPQ